MAPGKHGSALPPSGRPPGLGMEPVSQARARLFRGVGIRLAPGHRRIPKPPSLASSSHPPSRGRGFSRTVCDHKDPSLSLPQGKVMSAPGLPDPTLRADHGGCEVPTSQSEEGHSRAPPGKTATSPPPRMPRPLSPAVPTLPPAHTHTRTLARAALAISGPTPACTLAVARPQHLPVGVSRSRRR